MEPLPFPLRHDRAAGTLTGFLPEAAVPVYRIPVEFRRVAPVEQAAAPVWTAPPRASSGASMSRRRSGPACSRRRDRRLFVGTDAGVLHAIDTAERAERSGLDLRHRQADQGPSGGGRRRGLRRLRQRLPAQLDKQSGAERWRAKVDAATPPRLPGTDEKSRWDRYGSSVVVDGPRLYVASRDKHLYALDAASGKELWRLATSDLMTATPTLWRDLLLFADFAGKVQAVDARDGKPRWSYDARLAVAGDLVVDDAGRVFVGSRSYDLIALDAATGKELWKHYYWFSWIESPPVVRGQTVYTGSSDGVGVYAIDTATGARRWKARVPAGPGRAPPSTTVSSSPALSATAPGPGCAAARWSASIGRAARCAGRMSIRRRRSRWRRRRSGASPRDRCWSAARVDAADLGGRVSRSTAASDGVFPDHGTRKRPHHHAAAATSRRTG